MSMVGVVDRRQVEQRIEDWSRRLSRLADFVSDFHRGLPPGSDCQLLRGEVLQNSEELMNKFEVPPRMLPTVALVQGVRRVSFVPVGLWVLGANGRVSVTTNKRSYILVDVGGLEGAASDWRIVASKAATFHRPLDRTVLEELLERQELL